jgi:hypothetical protein
MAREADGGTRIFFAPSVAAPPALTEWAPPIEVVAPLPPDALGYTDVVSWHNLGGFGIVLHTVARSTGRLFTSVDGRSWSQRMGALWSPANARPSVQLFGSLSTASSDFDALVLFGGNNVTTGEPLLETFVILGSETDPQRFYAWLRAASLPGRALSLNVADVLNNGASFSAWVLHAISAADKTTHAYASLYLGDDWFDRGPVVGVNGHDTFFFTAAAAIDTVQLAETLFWLSTNGSDFAYPLEAIPQHFSSVSDPLQERIVIQPGGAAVPSRRGVTLARALSPPGVFPGSLLGPLLVGGVDMNGTPLTDAYIGIAVMTCFKGSFFPPACLPCPSCGGRGQCIPSYRRPTPCVCEAGWNAATNCTSCVPGSDCDGSAAAAAAAAAAAEAAADSRRAAGVIAAAAIASLVLLSSVAWAAARLRRRRRQTRAVKFSVFLSYDWGQGKANARLIASKLRARDISVWFDESHMRQAILQSMVDGVATSRAAVLHVTRLYTTRPNCLIEAEQIFVRASGLRGESMPVMIVFAGGFDPRRELDPGHIVRRLAELPRTEVRAFEDSFGKRRVAGRPRAAELCHRSAQHGPRCRLCCPCPRRCGRCSFNSCCSSAAVTIPFQRLSRRRSDRRPRLLHRGIRARAHADSRARAGRLCCAAVGAP